MVETLFTPSVQELVDHARNHEKASMPPWLMNSDNWPSLAFVFTDMVGSTELMQKVGDEEWSRLLDRHFERARELIERHHGHEVDNAGDGLFCVFALVQPAFRFLTELRANPGDPRVRIRGGIHFAPAHARSRGQFCGRAVHFTARVMAQAQGPEIWISDVAKEMLCENSPDTHIQNNAPWPFEPLATVPELEEMPEQVLKGFSNNERLWRLRD